jgi:hypothetical protein
MKKKFSYKDIIYKGKRVAALGLVAVFGVGVALTSGGNTEIPVHDGDVLVDSLAVSEEIAAPADGTFDEMRAVLELERNKLIATDTYADLLGVWLPSLFPFFVDYLPRTIPTRSIYLGGALIFIAMVIIFRIYGFFTLKERVPLASREEMNNTSVFKSVKQVASCRPMWVLLIKNFFGMGKAVGQNVSNYFWLNCTGKLSNAAISGIFTGLPSYFVLPFATKWTKKIGLKNLAVLSYLY